MTPTRDNPLRRLLLAGLLCGACAGSAAADPLLDESVAFAGASAPGLVIAAVRDGETAFAGYGETARGSGVTPTVDAMTRIASISKAFRGDVLASLVARGEIGLTDPLQSHLPDGFTVPEKDGRALRIIDLATQTSGLPQNMPQTGDGLSPVLGRDENGLAMDAMALAWVVVEPDGNHPLILRKTGGRQGMFTYVAIAQTRGIGVFAAINAFDTAGFLLMVERVNKLIFQLAPR